MKSDKEFFHQIQEAPRAVFARSLYQGINLPIHTNTESNQLHKTALSFTAVCVLLLGVFFIYLPSRVNALNGLRQIGAYTINTDVSSASYPGCPSSSGSHC